MPLAGQQLTMQQALALCSVRGWHNAGLTTAVAVMMAESGRFLGAWHDNLDIFGKTTSTDRGLFQVNDVSHPTLSDREAYNGVENAIYAHGLWQTQGFRPWAAYNSGAWLRFRRDVRIARLKFWSWRHSRPTIDATVAAMDGGHGIGE